MRLSKTRGIMMLFFSLVLTAFVLDRFTGGPRPAAGTPSAVSGSAPAPPAVPPIVRRTQPGAALPAPLNLENLRDVFQLPAALQQRLTALPQPEPVETETAEEAAGRGFGERHALRGVLLGTRPLALIDEGIYAEGGWIDGYQVVQILRDRVRLRRDKDEVTLFVPAPRPR